MTPIFVPMGLTQSAAVSTVATLTIASYGQAQTIRLTNIGTQTVYVLFNDLINTATSANAMPLLANTVEVFTVGADANGSVTIQHVAAGAGSTLYVTRGIGN
jgi:hypothetical protein